MLKENSPKVRVLIPADDDITSTTIKQAKSTYPQIDIRSIDKSLQTRITIVIHTKSKADWDITLINDQLYNKILEYV